MAVIKSPVFDYFLLYLSNKTDSRVHLDFCFFSSFSNIVQACDLAFTRPQISVFFSTPRIHCDMKL